MLRKKTKTELISSAAVGYCTLQFAHQKKRKKIIAKTSLGCKFSVYPYYLMSSAAYNYSLFYFFELIGNIWPISLIKKQLKVSISVWVANWLA